MKTMLCALALVTSVPVVTGIPAARARVVRIEITAQQPYGSFQAGDYVRLDGRIVGELVPGDEAIPDLAKAAPNAGGKVEYATKFNLFIPADAAHGNGALLVDVPNRGKQYAQALYNSPRTLPMQSGNLEAGTGFLENQGYAIAEVQWELGQGAELPSFTDAQGQKRFVEGVGFAIVRDWADFLAHAPAAAGNPLAGRISRTLASGKSQDGRFLKTFLLNGFNQVGGQVGGQAGGQAGGRRVFDGMHVFVSAAGLLPILQSGPGPASSGDKTPSFAEPDYPGVNDGVLTIGEIVSKAVARGEVPPKMLLINSTVDYLSIRASLGRTGASGTVDLPLPTTVRMYDVAGASHVTVTQAPGCNLSPGRLDWAPVARATLQRLDEWVATNVAPPPTTLMPLQAAAGDEAVLQAPAYLKQAVVQVPQRDAGGNPVGGIRLPDVVVPTGANGLQNRPASFSCSLVGAFQRYDAATLASLYKSQGDYVNRIRVAARDAVAAGFMLPEDAAVIVNSAAETPVLGAVAAPVNPR